MKRSFKLSEFTSLDDVAEWTATDPPDEIELKITATSGFAPTVEGVALGALQQLAQRAALTTECSVDPAKAPKLFESLFGLSLALTSRAITALEGKDQKTATADRLWRAVLQARGQIGTGNHVSIVFRDPDYWMPQCLRSPEGLFPKRDLFSFCVGEGSGRDGFPEVVLEHRRGTSLRSYMRQLKTHITMVGLGLMAELLQVLEECSSIV